MLPLPLVVVAQRRQHGIQVCLPSLLSAHLAALSAMPGRRWVMSLLYGYCCYCFFQQQRWQH
jgi:hypothetical protein